MTGLTKAATKDEEKENVDQGFDVNYDPGKTETILNEGEGLENELRVQSKPFKDRMFAYDQQIAEGLGFDSNSLMGRITSAYAKVDNKALQKVADKKLKGWVSKFDSLRTNMTKLNTEIEGDAIYEPAQSIDDIQQKKMEMQGLNVGLRYQFELSRDEADMYTQLARESQTGVKESQEKIGLINSEMEKYKDKDDPSSKAVLYDLRKQKRETERTLERAQTNFVRTKHKADALITDAVDLKGELQQKELERGKYSERATQINGIISYFAKRIGKEVITEPIIDGFQEFDGLAKNFGVVRKSIQQRNDIRLSGKRNYFAGQQNDMYARVKKEHNEFITASLNGVDDLETRLETL